MIFVMVVLLLVFGAKRLPELGSGLGKGIREFKRSISSLGSEIERSTEERELNPGQRPPAVPASTEPKRDDSTSSN